LCTVNLATAGAGIHSIINRVVAIVVIQSEGLIGDNNRLSIIHFNHPFTCLMEDNSVVIVSI